MDERQLPQRGRSHELETESINWTRQCFPSSWTVERVQGDYGTDLLVEVFQYRHPTGMMLNVQVKSSDRGFPTSSEFAHRAKVSWLNYCLTRPSPVILVQYFAPERRALWLWVKDYIRLQLDVTRPTWQQQQTIGLPLPRTRGFGSGSMGEILAYLYSGGWEKTMQQYRMLIDASYPRRELDVLGIKPPAVDATELAHLLGILPQEVHDRVRRCHSIVERVRDQLPTAIDDGQYVAEHLPRLAVWVAQQRAKLSQCQSNLKQLGIAALSYEQDVGRLPSVTEWPDQLLPYVRNEAVFRCPAREDAGYALNPVVADAPSQPSRNIPLFFDSIAMEDAVPDFRHLLGCCACMSDGHSEWLTSPEFVSLPQRR